MRVTLNGINRKGLVEWRGRERFLGKTVRIWSAEHRAWWRPNGNGYTSQPDQAGLYDFADAYDATKHCGPEKQIAYEVVSAGEQNIQQGAEK